MPASAFHREIADFGLAKGPKYEHNSKVAANQELIEEISLLKEKIKELEQSERNLRETVKELKERRTGLEMQNEELLEEPHLFRAIANYARDWENWFGPDGTIIWVSPSVLDITGYSVREALNMDHFPFPLIPETDRERMLSLFAEAMQNTSGNDVEFPVLCKDGTRKYVSVSWQPIYDDEGTNLGHRSSIRDITKRKLAEEALRQSEEKFEVAFRKNAIPMAITTIKEGRYVDVNEAFSKMMGFPRERLIGNSSTGVGWTTAQQRSIFLNEFNRKECVENLEVEMRMKGKQLRHGLFNATKIKIADDDYFLTMVTDITERRKMEEELKMHRDNLSELVAERTAAMVREVAGRKEKEEQYLALVESIRGWAWETDANFVHTYVSSGVQDILGYGPEEITGKSPTAFMTAREVKRAKPLIKRIFSQKKPFVAFQNIVFHKDGHSVYIEANGVPFVDEKGKLLGYRGNCRDITEQKMTMDALKERERELTAKSSTLEEVNATLRVLLKQREEDRKELEEKFVSNVREMVLPYIRIIQKGTLDLKHKTYLDVAASNLNEIISPYLNTMRQLNFTPKEIEVASLIRDGRTTKEIAVLMGVASSAIDSHRNNIRIKLGLNKKKANLRSYLLSLK